MKHGKRAATKAANGILVLLAALHRWTGAVALFFLLYLALTGVLLNHAADFGLDRRYVAADWLLDWYGIEVTPPIAAYHLGRQRLAAIDSRLYLDEHPVADHAGEVYGAAEFGGIFGVALADGLLLLDFTGDKIDLVPWPVAGAPPALGTTAAGDLVAVYQTRQFRLGDDLLTWLPESAQPPKVIAPETLAHEFAERLAKQHRATVLTWERALLDIHAGRLFGLAGRWIEDLAALAIFFLAVSGLWSWWLRRKRQRALFG